MKKKNNNKYSASQLFNFRPDSYLERTSRPIYAVWFLLPFIVFYELGTILSNTSLLKQHWQGRVVAFVWLESFLEYIGFSSKFVWIATPLAVLVILFCLQLTSRNKWKFWPQDTWRMTAECVLLAIPLIVLSLLLGNFTDWRNETASVQTTDFVEYTENNNAGVVYSEVPAQTHDNGERPQILVADIVTSIGAGIYEELVFRLILISLLMILLQNVLRIGHKTAIIMAVLISAALFSAHHHIVFIDGQLVQSSPFRWTEFSFRTIAGIYFAVVFAFRGFGITAGTHAIYDIIAVSVNFFFF